MSECACGCGAQIGPRDPSPDFKYIQCNLLWLASVDQPDPPWWRAVQRYRYRLISLESRWSECHWESEVTDAYISLYFGEGDYEEGLARMIQRWVQYFRAPAPELDVRVPGSATPGV